MKGSVVALVLGSSLLLYYPAFAQTVQDRSGNADLDVLGVLPTDLLPKMQRLAEILQQNIKNGKLSDAAIPQELHEGDLAAVIGRWGPEAGHLLEEIRTSLQANYSEESLSAMLHMLMGSTQGLTIGPPE